MTNSVVVSIFLLFCFFCDAIGLQNLSGKSYCSFYFRQTKFISQTKVGSGKIEECIYKKYHFLFSS